MTKLITSDVDRYLSICSRLDEGDTYVDIIAELHISRSIISKIVKHRRDDPNFEYNEREKIIEAGLALARKKTTKKSSTNSVPNSTISVPNSTIAPLRKEMLIDEFEQLETYFRKGTRTSMAKAISNFKKHLGEL